MAQIKNMNDIFKNNNTERSQYRFANGDDEIIVKQKKKAFLQISMLNFYAFAKGILRDDYDIVVVEDNDIFQYLTNTEMLGHKLRKIFLDGTLEAWNDTKLNNIVTVINGDKNIDDDDYIDEQEVVLTLTLQVLTSLNQLAEKKN